MWFIRLTTDGHLRRRDQSEINKKKGAAEANKRVLVTIGINRRVLAFSTSDELEARDILLIEECIVLQIIVGGRALFVVNVQQRAEPAEGLKFNPGKRRCAK